MTSELQRQLSKISVGDHLCLIYDAPDEVIPVAASFLREGLERGEAAFYVVDDNDLERVQRGFQDAGIDVAGALERGMLKFLSAREYCPLDVFEPQAMLARFRDLGAELARTGVPAARAAVEMTWALSVGAPLDLLADYECWGNHIFEDFTGMSLCMYNRHRFPAAAMDRLLRAHPIVVLGEEVTPNPFYEPPEVFFAEDRDAVRFEWMLSRLGAARADRLEREQARVREIELRDQEAALARSEFLARAARTLAASLDPLEVERAGEQLRFEIPEGNAAFQTKFDTVFQLALENARLYQAALAARDEAERANRVKVDFLSAMSHELRTPLNAISGYAELLDIGIGGSLTDEQHRMLARLKSSQEHLTHLINDVLYFARIEAGRLEFEAADVALKPLLDDVGMMLELQAESRGITYSCAPYPPDLAVHCDADRLRQILINLLGNALKFTAPGGQVRITCDVQPDDVILAVHDTGRGIAAEHRDAIFDPFVQRGRERQESSQQGVGLGLAISRDLARSMGGDITVESRLGVGSTFSVRIPRARTATPRAAEVV